MIYYMRSLSSESTRLVGFRGVWIVEMGVFYALCLPCNEMK